MFYCCIFELLSGSRTRTCVRNLKKVDKEAFKKARIRIFRSLCDREREREGGVVYFHTFSDMSIS